MEAAPDQGRHETPLEGWDRNLGDLLQELRVLQTGPQILAGFLLILPFQSRFDELSRAQLITYLVGLALAVLTVLLLIAPVGVHRAAFHRRHKQQVVQLAHVFTRLGLAMLGLSMSVVLGFIFSVVLSPASGWWAGGLAVVAFTAGWFVLPLWLSRVWDEQDQASGTTPGDPEQSPNQTRV
ncbi:DUF6328 family protein [Propionibacteriaceae bacterium G1746]|uniref:DUF6328 family protein n=1 Tax=Aestuariimicrobium sp. G57 TaxID=3418485 RepID=UPI003C294551